MIAGDSAGANIALSLAIACAGGYTADLCPELQAAPSPSAVFCGSDVFQLKGSATAYSDSPVTQARLTQIEQDYLASHPNPQLAEPLAALQRAGAQGHSLPLAPIFIAMGERDPIKDHSESLARALSGPHRLARYPKEGHAFMVSPFSSSALRCWQQFMAFVDEHDPTSALNATRR